MQCPPYKSMSTEMIKWAHLYTHLMILQYSESCCYRKISNAFCSIRFLEFNHDNITYFCRKKSIFNALWRYAVKLLNSLELCRLIRCRFGNRHCSESSGSWMEERELLARMSDVRRGYRRPSLRTSFQSCSRLSVMCSRRREGQGTRDKFTRLYSFKHRKSSSSLQQR